MVNGKGKLFNFKYLPVFLDFTICVGLLITIYHLLFTIYYLLLMILHFETESVMIETTDLDVLVVGFYTDENYLMIQQSLDEYDEQDIRLGMNTYHIERDDQSYGGYGGVERIKLQSDSIEVELNETGRKNLQCDGVQIDFQTDAENFELLTEKLGYIFGDLLTVNR
jgi:hypothetical protein